MQVGNVVLENRWNWLQISILPLLCSLTSVTYISVAWFPHLLSGNSNMNLHVLVCWIWYLAKYHKLAWRRLGWHECIVSQLWGCQQSWFPPGAVMERAVSILSLWLPHDCPIIMCLVLVYISVSSFCEDNSNVGWNPTPMNLFFLHYP